MRAQLSISRLAARQHGVVARHQLLDLGLDRGHIGRAVAAGHLLRLHRGVYAVGHRAVADRGRWMGATLACADDRTTRHDIPVTTVARTLADLAHSLDDQSLHRAVREAQFKDLFDDAKIRDTLTRRRARPLAAYLDDPTVIQTDLEDRFLRICRRYRIPTPVTQYGTRPRVDFTWPDRQVIVEVDGWQAHRTRVAFQDDRTNTNRLQLAGNIVLRYTWDDVRIRHAEVAAQVLSAGNFSSTHSAPSGDRRYGRPPTRT